MITKNKINYNLNKAIETVKIFKIYFNDNNSIALVDYPKIIEYKSNEYFIYIFYSCMLDYGMKSIPYHNNLINTYLKYPNIFNPEFILNNSDILDDIIKNSMHVRYPKVAKSKWIKLSKFLYENKDLKSILYSFNTYKELSSFIESTASYGQKTGGLLKRVIADDIGKYRVEDIPIDRHDIEISYLLGVVSDINLNDKEIKALSDIWVKASIDENVNPSLVDQYLWTIGVNFCAAKKCLDCPLNNICKKK